MMHQQVTVAYAMVILDRVDDHKVGQVVHVGSIIAMPGHHIKGAVILDGLEQVALIFVDDLVLLLDILEPSGRRFEIARVSQSIGSCVIK